MEVNGTTIATGIPYLEPEIISGRELVFGFEQRPKAATTPKKIEVRKLKPEEKPRDW